MEQGNHDGPVAPAISKFEPFEFVIGEVEVRLDLVGIRTHDRQNVPAFQLAVRVVPGGHVPLGPDVEVLDEHLEVLFVAADDQQLLQLLVGPDAERTLWNRRLKMMKLALEHINFFPNSRTLHTDGVARTFFYNFYPTNLYRGVIKERERDSNPRQ